MSVSKRRRRKKMAQLQHQNRLLVAQFQPLARAMAEHPGKYTGFVAGGSFILGGVCGALYSPARNVPLARLGRHLLALL